MPLPTSLPAAFGRYRLLHKLGEGGMGAVFLAEDSKLRRQVAIKVPHFDAATDPKVIERFQREARVAAAVEHPNLCGVHDVADHDGIHYLVMPLVEGKPLSKYTGQPWAPEKAVKLVRRLAGALQALHGRGVMHRDLKPSNVMMRPDGTPVLMDFGLARAFGEKATRLTHTGATVGTPAYMSPEQANGQGRELGPTTDVYSLGVILYELLAGQVPFDAPTIQGLLGQIFFQEPSPPSTLRAELPQCLDAVCLKALAKKPEERYSGMAEFIAALDAAQLSCAPKAPAPPPKTKRPTTGSTVDWQEVADPSATGSSRPTQVAPVKPSRPRKLVVGGPWCWPYSFCLSQPWLVVSCSPIAHTTRGSKPGREERRTGSPIRAKSRHRESPHAPSLRSTRRRPRNCRRRGPPTWAGPSRTASTSAAARSSW
jgi:serine/threonine-protein kinase